MNISPSDIREQFQAFGLKSTPQRTAIYEALVKSTAHPTAEEIYAQVSPRFPMMSLNTVYYTLGALRRVGLIQEVNIGHDRARFDANLSPHHHLICLRCQTIIDVVDSHLNNLSSQTILDQDFEVTHYQVAFQGYCGPCRQHHSSSRGYSSSGETPSTL